MAADGSLNFDTGLETKGFVKGIKEIKDGSDTGSAIVGMTDEIENNVEDIIDNI